MNLRTLGILLIVAGALGLAYGSFSVTRDTRTARLGPVQLTVQERETVNIPIWLGVGAILVGGALLLYGSRNS